MRLCLVLGLLLCTGCASTAGAPPRAVAEPQAAMPKTETVYLVSLDEAMLVTRQLLEERKYDVFERGKLELVTSARELSVNPKDFRSWERYYVRGDRVGPRHSIVRVFRLRYNEQELTIEQPPKVAGQREEEEYKAAQKRPFDRDPFEVGDVERFMMAQGRRDLDLERQLLERLEMVPSLELMGGKAAVPIRSVVVDGWGDAAGQQASAAPCGEPLAGVEPLLTPGLTLLLADPLGTQEVPAAATRLLCGASGKGLSVALGLSLPVSEQPLLDAYLAGEGRPQDVEQFLVRSSFWRRAYQDGRSSRAVLWLIEQARRLRASGRAVEVVAFDSDDGAGNAREAEMAQRLLAYRQAHPDTWLLAVAGDVHVRTARVEWDEEHEPLGARLARALPAVRALTVGFQRGTHFACRYNVWEKVDCNIFALSPTPAAEVMPGTPPGVQLFAGPNAEGFHGRLILGPLTASPPALQRLARSDEPPGPVQ